MAAKIHTSAAGWGDCRESMRAVDLTKGCFVVTVRWNDGTEIDVQHTDIEAAFACFGKYRRREAAANPWDGIRHVSRNFS